MSNDLISREALKKAIEEYKYCGFYDKLIELIDNAPSVEPFERIGAICEENCGYRPQGELTETKHRLNLLIGVLYSNQVISENDIEYIEDSIKELIKGGAE